MTQDVSVIPYPSRTSPKHLEKRVNGVYYLGSFIINRAKLVSYNHHATKLAQTSAGYILRNSMTSGDNGEAPEVISLIRPPSLALILLNTNLSHIGDGFVPNNRKRRSNISLSCRVWKFGLLVEHE
jgi:hypothetical protein